MPFRETLQQFNQPRHSFFVPKNDVTDGPSSPTSLTPDFWKPKQKTAGKVKVKPLYPDQDYEQIVRRLQAGGGRLFEGRISSILISRAPTILRSHWSRASEC